jgi:hypothetical protein
MSYLKALLVFSAVFGIVYGDSNPIHLNRSLELLSNKLADYETTFTYSPLPIEPSCLSYYSNLAELGSLFTQCVVSYSRPFRVCENCLKYYLEIKEAKELIKNDVDVYATSLYKKGLKCEDIVDATDKVQTIVKIFSLIDTIWSSANCNGTKTLNSFIFLCVQNYNDNVL